MSKSNNRKVGIEVIPTTDDAKPAAKKITEKVVRLSITEEKEPLKHSSSLPSELDETTQTEVIPPKSHHRHHSLKDHHVHFNESDLLPEKNAVTTRRTPRRGDFQATRAKSLPSNAFKHLADDLQQATNGRRTTPRSESLKELSLPHHEHFVFDDDSDIFVKQADNLLDPRSKSPRLGESASVDESERSIPECDEEEEEDSGT